MSIEKEEPGLYVAYCDGCGERKELDTEVDQDMSDAVEEVEEMGWEAKPPETVKFANDYSRTKLKITYCEHYCPDCQ